MGPALGLGRRPALCLGLQGKWLHTAQPQSWALLILILILDAPI
ncbi:hypothetical protein E2C01_078132 [Portunus trituberculatus]|uniref:Uncharacterized protein n=1 Tax=Portunus trituberculatus TaxID=210409 RepID=A0A5B7ILU5_PORTR|nr:hypothetical protein [Portunus trituberculatus]